MTARDTVPFRLTKKTKQELERIKNVVAKELGIDVNNINYKHAEIVMRIKSSRGKVFVNELKDIILGKIK